MGVESSGHSNDTVETLRRGDLLLSSDRAAWLGGKVRAMNTRQIEFAVGAADTSVSGLLVRPADARCLLVLGHGAGAGMRHPFMARLSERLAADGIASLRYQFPYMEAGRRRPDRRDVLLATVNAAVEVAAGEVPGLPLLAGGKSMGGRMTSLAAAEAALPRVQGLVFFGFPLHPAGRPSIERAAHLDAVRLPMLFLAGERDRLAELELLRPVCADLGPRAKLHVVAGADHGFHVLKRSGRTDDEVLGELAAVTGRWAEGMLPARTEAPSAPDRSTDHPL